MLHTVRNPDGSIQLLARQPLPGSTPIDASAIEVTEFLQRSPESGFNAADAEFVRVLEDLIDTLIGLNVIRHTDLPPAAQKKLMLRKGLRNRIAGALDLLGRDERLL